MNENPLDQGHMVDTNDSLEAVSVFRGWKNVFFGILVACLLLTQAAFWLINLKIVSMPAVSEPAAGSPGAVTTPGTAPASNAGKAVAAGGVFGILDFDRTARAIELINGVLIVAAVLLAASIFFGLMVSLVGRLGGLNHISRAFVLSLIAVALLIPWQVLGLNVLGVTWTPDELARWLPAKNADIVSTVIFYLRFTGYWAAVVLLLLLSQARSTRWSKSILHRLEII
jgi:flagellar biosynthesis protein FliQ